MQNSLQSMKIPPKMKLFERQRKSRKAQTVQIVVMLVVALVVVGILIYIGYKYILGTGENVGELGGCRGQGGECVASSQACKESKGDSARAMYGLGCEGTTPYCCIPSERFTS